MPHRILPDISIYGLLVELFLLGGICVSRLAEWSLAAFTDSDWSRFLGPHGFTVGLILAVAVLWGNGVADRLAQRKRDARAEDRRERRHAEAINMQKENADKLMSITVESILAHGKTAIALERLSSQLEKRPCQCKIDHEPL